MPDVLILMGSDSDAPVMQAAVDALKEFGISSEMTVASAHRSPARECPATAWIRAYCRALSSFLPALTYSRLATYWLV